MFSSKEIKSGVNFFSSLSFYNIYSNQVSLSSLNIYKNLGFLGLKGGSLVKLAAIIKLSPTPYRSLALKFLLALSD